MNESRELKNAEQLEEQLQSELSYQPATRSEEHTSLAFSGDCNSKEIYSKIPLKSIKDMI